MSTVKTAICRPDTGDVAASVKPYEEEIPWKIEGEGKVEKFFDNRAHYYDKQMEGIYNGPRISAQQLTKFVTEKEKKILDIAAGTGLIGKALFDEGFTNITAIDRNEQMLKQAASKGVYTEIHMGSFEDNSLADNSFHACVCVGAFLTSGFLDPVRAVKEMIRLTAIDGIILIMVNGTELGECKSVMQSLVGAFSAATEKGLCNLVTETFVPNYLEACEGVMWVLRKKMT